jgi:hypothetical protein
MLHGNALPPEARAGMGMGMVDGDNNFDMLNPDHGPGVKRNRSGSFSNLAHKKSPVISALPQPMSAGSKFAIKIPDLQDDDDEESQKYAQFGSMSAGRSSRPGDAGMWSEHSSSAQQQHHDHGGMSSNMDEEAVQDIPFEDGPSSQGADPPSYGRSVFVSPKPASTGGLGNFLWVPGSGSTDARDKFAFTPGGGGGGSRFSENEGRDRSARESRFSPRNGDANSHGDNGWTDNRNPGNRINQNVFAGGSRYPSALDAHVPGHVQDRFAVGGSTHAAQVKSWFQLTHTHTHTHKNT